MRFRHLTLDEQLKKTEKTDDRTVAKAQLLHSKEWQEHISEHHGTGPKPQLVAVNTTDDSNIFKKTDEKKEEKDESQKPQHTVDHGQVASNPRTGYIGNTSTGVQRGAGDEYFGAGSSRLKAISGQCSCGMEVSTGFNSEQTTGQKLKAGYATSLFERETTKQQDQGQPLYASGATAQSPVGGQQERSLYSTNQPSGFGAQNDQRRRRTSAL